MSAALVESMAADFEPDHFTDDYQVQLRQLIDAKLERATRWIPKRRSVFRPRRAKAK